MLKAGYVGAVYHISIRWGMTMQHDARPDVLSWRFRPENGGGTVYELVHVFDMARFLNGEIARVCALLNTAEPYRGFVDAPQFFRIEVPDSSAFMLEFVNGGYAVVHTSFVQRGTAAGSGVTVDVCGSRGRLVTVENSDLAPVDPGPPYAQPYERWVTAIRENDQSQIDTGFETGLGAARVVDAAYQSWEEKRWVDVGA